MEENEKRNMMDECYSCEHRRTIPGDAHTRCSNPDPEMTGDEHGIKSGWFNYPENFDPVWKTKFCNNYESHKSVNHAVSGAVSQETNGQNDQG